MTRLAVRLVVAAVTVTLAVPLGAATVTSPASARGRAGAAPTAHVAPADGLARPRAEAAGDVVPCPIAKAPPLPNATPAPPRPALPPPPTPDPAAVPVGGERLGTPGLVLPESSPALPPTLTAHAWVLADAGSGEVLAACAPHALHAPASTQKLLTALAVLPKVDPKQVVTVTPADLDYEPGSSAVGLVKGGRYTVATLLLGLLLVSGNDAANVLARVAGGPKGLAGTVSEMNAVAARVGALDTHAVTPSGLDAPGQWTSAYDLALIARAAFLRPDFRRYAATPRTQVPAQKPTYAAFQIQNDNQLLATYPGALGGKTGFTDLARHTFVGAAERGARRLVVTLLQGERRPTRLWQQAAALLDWGFALPVGTPEVGRLVAPGDSAGPEPTSSASTPDAAPDGRPSIRPVAVLMAVGGAAGVVLLGGGAAWLSGRRARRRAARTGSAGR